MTSLMVPASFFIDAGPERRMEAFFADKCLQFAFFNALGLTIPIELTAFFCQYYLQWITAFG
ncbi:hypothetical protein [Chromobacterium sp.]|uniref:hypothetical protein n=1 Tax=Chromobacterium sp. TaxID=306190 RepID=UPI0035B0B227